MANNLVIVESPAKAKTIEKFLGKDYIVKSSYGHVRDLAKKDSGINIENNFEPTYEISPDKERVIKELSSLAKKAEMVWLATDEDREGEAISWHLFETLKLKESETKRIVFHEITKDAILNAISNPRKIDKNLVDAQQARRVLDRIVGFELSPILWKKVKPSLSAGRVQSVAVRLIVEREREIDAHASSSSYKVTGNFLVYDQSGNPRFLKSELPVRFKEKTEAEDFLESLKGSHFSIENLEKKPGKRSPSAPFTTSTLQQEASRKLGFSVSQTMMIAQRLYESGHITYMRTDSVTLSQQALGNAAKEINRSYGNEYHHQRQFQTKSASAQEAHEAIRPTYFNNTNIDGDSGEQRLYDLIWKRSIASQMADARLEKTIVTIKSDKVVEKFIATGEVILFDGFLRVYMEGSDEENTEDESQSLLPPLEVGQKVELDYVEARERFTNPPARYTEASLVKKLEELGIGRPSTYAPTISTVQKRNYVVKEDRQGRERIYNVITLKDNYVLSFTKTEITGAEKAKLFPTDIGAVVNDFLVANFKEVLDFNFTATVEQEFDEIANGKMEWHEMLHDFYKPFHKTVLNTEKHSERASGERELGIDPKTGKKVIVRLGRYGPLVQIGGGLDSDDEPKFASMRPGQRLETITFEEAMDLFKLPRNLGQFEDKDLIISIGRFGPYAKLGDEFFSLGKDNDPYTITYDETLELINIRRSTPDLARNPRNLGKYNDDDVLISRGRFGPYIKNSGMYISIPRSEDPFTIELNEAIELIKKKALTESQKLIKAFPENKDVQILNGRWGPYIAVGKKNFKIPKDKDGATLTLEECLAIAGVSDKKGKKEKSSAKSSPAKKKSAAKKSPAKKKSASKAKSK